MMRRVLSYVLVGYLSIGFALGSILFFAIPAVNVWGWTYYTVTWPAHIWYANTKIGPAPPIPAWIFTFEEQK